MAAEETRRIVPRGDLQGSLGSGEKRWEKAYIGNVSVTYDTVADMVEDLELREGMTAKTKGFSVINDGGSSFYFIRTKTVSDTDTENTIFLDNGKVAVAINQKDKALTEVTGYGVVSGCTPSISNLTVTVDGGVVHLENGRRVEKDQSTITLDTADNTNPRIDVVYFNSNGEIAKVTGIPAASPVTPSIPANGIGIAVVSVPANATVGTLTNTISLLNKTQTYSLADFPGGTNEEKLHNALSNVIDAVIYCGNIKITKSFDIASNNIDYRRVTLVGANITIDSVPMFTSSDPTSMSGIHATVPSFSNCFIKGNNSTYLFDDFNLVAPKFDNCKIVACPLFYSTTKYVQSLYLNNTDIQLMNTDMVTATRLYNFNMANCRVEYGSGRLFVLWGESGIAIFNGTISNCLIEGRSASILYSEGGFYPLVIKNCYFEGNTAPYINVNGTNLPARTYVTGCYFNIDNVGSSDYVFAYNNSKTTTICVIEENVFLKSTTGTAIITDAQNAQGIFLRKFYNTLVELSGATISLYKGVTYEFTCKSYSPTVSGSNLIVKIPLHNPSQNLWLTNLVLDIDFFGTKSGGGTIVARDYIHLKVALVSNTATTVAPVIVDSYKTNNATSVTATIENNAYNSKNSVLVLTFSGFDTTSLTYDVCKAYNNNMVSMWDG